MGVTFRSTSLMLNYYEIFTYLQLVHKLEKIIIRIIIKNVIIRIIIRNATLQHQISNI